jgi:hypothetical protein
MRQIGLAVILPGLLARQFTAVGQNDKRGRRATFDTTDMQRSSKPCRHKRTV